MGLVGILAREVMFLFRFEFATSAVTPRVHQYLRKNYGGYFRKVVYRAR